MRRTLSAVLSIGALLHGLGGAAQTHKVARPEQVVRAVGVYEWTGDLKKPTGSRLIPVTLFIDGALQDAGVYLARPIPFALTPGSEYELQQAGIARGALDLAYARHLQTADSAYEDGWFGYGSYKAPPAAKKEPVLRASRNPAVLTSSKEDSRPHLGNKSDTGNPAKPDPAKPDPAPNANDKSSVPGDQGDSSQRKSSAGSAADDPDRPTMRRRSDSSAPSGDSPTSSTTGSSPANDPDRPTLRRRSPDDARKSKDDSNDVATVTGTGSLNNDPDRPNLHRGKPASSANDTDLPKLVGVPKDLKQMVAVSDAANRPPHDFTLAWQDEKDRAAVLAKMESLAKAQLLLYASDPLAPQTAPARPVAARPSRNAPGQGRAGQPGHASSKATARSTTSPEIALLDEELKAFTLSYGGAATYVYTAHTAGTGADLRYVTVVAQADVNGELRPAIKSATDEAHLDRTPRMRFVDAVDAEASNRASLLFELRSQSTRQFGLYRVIGSRADAFFMTGTTQ